MASQKGATFDLCILPMFPVISSRFKRDTLKMRSLRAPDIRNADFCLSLPTLLQCLLLRAVRSLLLMRSLTDATELYTGMELHISACCKPSRTLNNRSIEKQLVFPLNIGFR